MSKLKLFIISLIIIVASNIYAQNITQSVRGQIINKQTQATLPGATVIILESNPVIATITDNNGYFMIENIPIG
ncbi:MAG: carboxypeptidase-like regulatory domain-containing protein, partial [Bacteroidales bacterium]|nr:carboxypeptidase-like regulatory domain-containing protein [Bacteroidales bacterium]